MQPLHDVLLPCPGRSDSSPIEIEHVHLINTQQDVVGVQIRVMHAMAMEARDGCADLLPSLFTKTLRERLRERHRFRQLSRDQISTIGQTFALVVRSYRIWDGQAQARCRTLRQRKRGR